MSLLLVLLLARCIPSRTIGGDEKWNGIGDGKLDPVHEHHVVVNEDTVTIID